MAHRSDWKKRSWRRYTALAADWIIGLVLVGSLLTTAAAQYERDYNTPLEDWTQPFPFAGVQELFPEHEVRQEVSLIESEVHHWSNALALDEVRYAVGEHACLTAARTRENQKRTFRSKHGFALRVIQGVDIDGHEQAFRIRLVIC